MHSFDIAIFGAGIVGLSLAKALEGTQLKIALIDPQQPELLKLSDTYSMRVSAITPASRQFFESLDVWSDIQSKRCVVYEKMQVWEKDSFAAIDFSADELPAPELGYIIENDVIRDTLWQAVIEQSNVQLFTEPCTQVVRGERETWLAFAHQGPASAQLVVGADGAHSWLRQQCKVPLTFWDYQQTALVATIRTELKHQGVARQIFTPEGPLAFLPLADPNLCSIVWSVPPERAQMLNQLNVSEFEKALTMAFDHRLGLCHCESSSLSFPLRMRYAREFAGRRFVLIGDAAHTIHPLAGQGVNLGLGDARALARTLIDLSSRQQDIGLHTNLRSWERARKAQAQQMIAAMEFFKRLFSGSHPAKKLLRGFGVAMTDKLPGLKQHWMRQVL